ncbi:MAG TPA: MFS transporter [Gammaproteobacteria bacterium]|jgi:MFS family permease|nr:MFS transporter [Gammaproteobacteria bacterium]
MTATFRNIQPTARRLLLARSVRSVAQGAMVVDISLYLNALHWSGLAIGLTLSGAGMCAAVLSLGIGLLSDRLRRRPFLIWNELFTVVCGLMPLLSASQAVLLAAIVLGGFGRGMNGTAGPFGPAEQAWLADVVPVSDRGWIYSINNALGFFGMALGALLAMLAAWWMPGAAPRAAYGFLFVLVIIGALANLWLLYGAVERQRDTPQTAGARVRRLHRWENQLLQRLGRLNLLNGLSMGLIGPLISYWFALRFGVGPDRIGAVLAGTFALTGGMALFTGRMAMRHGLSRAVVWSRGIGVLLLVALPFMPWFWLAATAYMLRLAAGGASVGARQAQIVSLMRDQRRGLATSVNAASFQVPQSVGPGIAGPLIAAGFFVTPFCMSAALQLIYVVGYDRLFGRYDRPSSLRK